MRYTGVGAKMGESYRQYTHCSACHAFVSGRLRFCPLCHTALHSGDETIDYHYLTKSSLLKILMIPCPTCGSLNNRDFRYCKICRTPLPPRASAEPETDAACLTGSTSGLADSAPSLPSGRHLSLGWSKRSPGFSFLDTLQLDRPAACDQLAAAQWEGHTFLVSGRADISRNLIFRHDREATTHLSVLIDSARLIPGGTRFYIGALYAEAQIAPAVCPPARDNTTGPLDTGPGELIRPTPPPGAKPVYAGPTGVTLCETGNTICQFISLHGRTLLGRQLITEATGHSDESLRQMGVSKEHIWITPLAGGRLLVEPIPGKTVFVEIGPVPVEIAPGSLLRLICGERFGEFVMTVNAD
jgi:hypothetical protein